MPPTGPVCYNSVTMEVDRHTSDSADTCAAWAYYDNVEWSGSRYTGCYNMAVHVFEVMTKEVCEGFTWGTPAGALSPHRPPSPHHPPSPPPAAPPPATLLNSSLLAMSLAVILCIGLLTICWSVHSHGQRRSGTATAQARAAAAGMPAIDESKAASVRADAWAAWAPLVEGVLQAKSVSK